ncbi:MAG: methyltransferase domain-containing protein [Desulfatitalea sp.]|nr:methyltransferase domain-containing protein [Desulfatitalea sp.]
MESAQQYLMENKDEIERLERKTDRRALERQAAWAGLQPGMRVGDMGCGPGLTTRFLFEMAQPGGTAIGVDLSGERIAHATKKYGIEGLTFVRHNLVKPIIELGTFDFIWVRFALEYNRSQAFQIVQNLTRILNPGGIMCLIDLDYNCLNHFDMPERLMSALRAITHRLEEIADFDPYVGIKLYSFLYDLGFEEIEMAMSAHHLIFGELKEVDAFNWTKKLEIAVVRSGYDFPEFAGGYQEFAEEFQKFFSDPRRFTYTPLIACRGRWTKAGL